MTQKALGRGLNALFSATQKATPEEKKGEGGAERLDALALIRQIPVNAIQPNRHQPRATFEPAALEELADSIRTHGIAQPLVVTETGTSGRYELVAGERRLRAAKLAGLQTVPCSVKQMTNRERFEVALIENLQREDLNALEEAIALDTLMKEYDLTQEGAAAAIGKSRSAVANALRFLRLHEDVQAALRGGRISEGHAKVLAGVVEHTEQLRLLARILEDGLTVRDLETMTGGARPKRKRATAAPADTPEVKKYEEDFQRVLGRRVDIQTDGKKGWIRFAFYSPWDLELLCKRLGLIDSIEGESHIDAP